MSLWWKKGANYKTLHFGGFRFWVKLESLEVWQHRDCNAVSTHVGNVFTLSAGESLGDRQERNTLQETY